MRFEDTQLAARYAPGTPLYVRFNRDLEENNNRNFRYYPSYGITVVFSRSEHPMTPDTYLVSVALDSGPVIIDTGEHMPMLEMFTTRCKIAESEPQKMSRTVELTERQRSKDDYILSDSYLLFTDVDTWIQTHGNTCLAESSIYVESAERDMDNENFARVKAAQALSSYSYSSSLAEFKHELDDFIVSEDLHCKGRLA